MLEELLEHANALLNEHEQQMLQRLVTAQHLTDAQAQTALQRRATNKMPLLDILGAMNVIDLKQYASDLAKTAQTGYASDFIESEYFVLDADLIRRFEPAVMVRHLFCPLQLADDLLTVLVVDVDNLAVEAALRAVLPTAEIMPFVGTERDIKRLLNRVFGAEFLHHAVHHLAETNPEQSGSRVFTRPQLAFFAGLLLLTAAALVVNFWVTVRLLVIFITVLYLLGIGFKLLLSLLGMQNQRRRDRHFAPERLHAIPDADLPVYSILVPVYKEPAVVPNLLRALAKIDYPHEKLDVLILMEADDLETINAAKAAEPPAFFRFIVVPDSQPRTKPKACNYGLNFCRGEFVTIYDAEDIPEPDQLRKAVAAFHAGGERLICVQSALNYYNSRENFLTRMFTLEYTYWFDYMLPGLDRTGMPIPLGGTSNHFRMSAVRALGAWDPFNVTEDADLGMRITANGYTVGVIASTTFEEANSRTWNWIRQRSRWIKGYMQTWLVHNRHPLRLLRQIGLKKWLGFQLLIGGTFWVFLINPLMWALFILWVVFQPAWISTLFDDGVWTLAALSLLVGNGAAVGLNALAALSRRENRHLFIYSLTNPIYWTLHSVAAYKALWQLIRKPFYWEKTIHGLTSVGASDLFASGAPGSDAGRDAASSAKP